MRVHTKLTYEWDEQGRLQLVAEEGYDCAGPVAKCKGATSEQKSLEARQSAFYDTMTKSYGEMFAGQTAILKSLSDVWTPILQAGPGQKGFTTAEETALRTQATESTAAEYQKAAKAEGGQAAARGGGNVYLPSGTEEQVKGSIAAAGAESQATKNLAITQANYERGYDLFNRASGAMSGAASIYNPTGFAGQATGAGTAAGQTASEIQKAQQAASPWGAIGGIVGGVAGSFLGPVGGAIGSKIGSKIGSAAGGCWILTALYGKDTEQTKTMWAWMTNKDFGLNQRTWLGKKFVDWYYQKGEQIAENIRNSFAARLIWKAIFNTLHVIMLADVRWTAFVNLAETQYDFQN